MFERRVRRSSQPINPRLNQASPLAAGLQMLLVPSLGGGLVDVVNPARRWSPNAGATVKGASGRVAAALNGTGSYFSHTGYPEIKGNVGTFFVWSDRVGTPDTSGMVWLLTFTGNTVFFQSPGSNWYGWGAGHGLVPYENRKNSSYAFTSTGELYGCCLHIDGEYVNFSLAAATAFTEGDKVLEVGRASSGANWDVDADICIVGYSSRVWTQEELRSFHLNPWQLLDPLSTRRWPTPASPYPAPRPTVPVKKQVFQTKRVVRTSQPVAIPRIDQSNPITRGLVTCWSATSQLDAAHPPSTWAMSNTLPSIRVGKNGVHLATVNSGFANNGAIVSNAYSLPSGVPNTIIGVFNYIGSSSYIVSNLICVGSYGLFIDPSTRQLVEGALYAKSTATVPSNVPVVIGLTQEMFGLVEFWLNGKNAGGGFTDAGYGRGGALSAVGGSAGQGSTESGAQLVLVWDRRLSPDEIASVSANPWQLFAPQLRVSPSSFPAPQIASTPTLFYGIYPAANVDPRREQLANGLDGTGTAFVASGKDAAPAGSVLPYNWSVPARGLTPGAAYRLAVVFFDGTNYSGVSYGYFSATGGSTTPVLSSPGVFNITATTATPRVTITFS